ncbi:MAG: nucleoside deaminase [Bacteroidetes bacterium]|nr:nucleoside deaminase [Bacteroidota bacterium]
MLVCQLSREKGTILSICHTTLHKVNDPSAHAEMNAIREACKKVKSRYLLGAWLYTTQEPCPMCTSVAIWAKIEGIVFGAFEKDAMKTFGKNSKGKFTWKRC